MKIIILFLSLCFHLYCFCQTNFINDSVAILGADNTLMLREIFPDINLHEIPYSAVLYNVNSGMVEKTVPGLNINHVDVSNNLNILSALGNEVEKDSNGHIKIRRPGHEGLLILSCDLRILSSIDSVTAYSWDNNKESIVYIKGYRLQEKPMFVSTGVYILNVKDNKSEKIGDFGFDVSWQIYDNNIYIKDTNGVFVYDTKLRTLTKTEYWGIYFSADGIFYLNPAYEGAGIDIYKTQSNEIVKIDNLDSKNPSFFKWIGKDELIIGDVILEKKIIKISNRKIQKTFSGKIFGYNSRTVEIYVYKDKRFFKELADSKIEKFKYPSE